MWKRGVLASFFLLCLAAGADSQERPRIGVALSGGSARGFAHIGVLQWMEEHRIPIDCIAGTSAGGLVGGMYASGMSPAAMRETVRTADWGALMRGAPEYSSLSFRRKEDRRSYQTAIDLPGISLPAGLNAGHKIGLLFSRLCVPYADPCNFDDLPIPFRCVATEMVHGRKVVLKDGSLPQALRATMAIPGYFTPVVVDADTVLADGGLVDGLPTDIARQMGARVVIAVDVTPPVTDRTAWRSVFGSTSQAFAIMLEQLMEVQRAQADILISPDSLVPEFSQLHGTDYGRADAIADAGYRAAAASASRLLPYQLGESEWQEYMARRRARRPPAATPAYVSVLGTGRLESREIERRLESFCGKPLSTSALESNLTDAVGTERYESLGYGFVCRDGRQGLAVYAVPKELNQPALRPSLAFSGAEAHNPRVSLGGRITILQAGTPGPEWRIDGGIGWPTLFSAEYYRPVGSRGWFVAPSAGFLRAASNLYGGGAITEEVRRQEIGAGIDVGFANGRHSEFRIGARVGQVTQALHSGTTGLPTPDGVASEILVRYAYDGANEPVLPTRGARLEVGGRWMLEMPGAARHLAQADASIVGFSPVSHSDVLFVRAAGGTTLGGAAPLARQYAIGGPFALSGYGYEQFRGSSYLLGAAGCRHLLAESIGPAATRLYLGGWYEIGGAFETIRSASLHHSLTAGLLASTLLGEVTLGGSLSEGPRTSMFLSLGHGF